MLKHSFFYRPMIYFGSAQNIEHPEDGGEEEWDLEEEAAIFFGEDPLAHQKKQIGLFLYWFEEN